MSVENIKVCVLMGGVGAERAVSLDSGSNIAAAIRGAGIECVEFDITPDDMSILDDISIDVFFLGLHGKFGEDGELQQILEDKKLVYTGSGPKASADAFDKVISKEIFAKAGVDLPRHVCVGEGYNVEALAKELSRRVKCTQDAADGRLYEPTVAVAVTESSNRPTGCSITGWPVTSA